MCKSCKPRSHTAHRDILKTKPRILAGFLSSSGKLSTEILLPSDLWCHEFWSRANNFVVIIDHYFQPFQLKFDEIIFN